ncbi:MAG: lysophospholipid acyltransferase family protein [Candidatus Omnitrophica bacterium]|nr:lysophospholipid acyltransferase family protein [Candidatus Omnitrophota bacterium]
MKIKKKIFRSTVSLISITGLQILIFLLRIFPYRLICAVGNGVSGLYYLLAHKNRNLALRNLNIALGSYFDAEEVEKIAKQSFSTMGKIILDTLYYRGLSKQKVKSLIHIKGIEHLEKALKRGKGAVIISAHLGSFTLMGSRLTFEGFKSTFVARHARNKRVERIIMNFCRKVGQKIVFNRPILTCMRICIKILSRNEILIIEMDQNFGTEGSEVNFFGRPAMVASGPVKLALSTQAAVIPMFIVRQPNDTHIIMIEPELEMGQGDSNDEAVRINLQKIIDVVEKYIKLYPGQWVNWIHKRWKVEHNKMEGL